MIKQKLKPHLISLSAISLVLVTLTGCTAANNQFRESVMQRIIRSGKIRCSYLVYSSYFRKDPNTGKLSGIFHDLMEEIGKNADLQVEWVEEVGYEGIFPGLQSGRSDVFAGGLWANASRAKAAAFSEPVFYSAITPWVRPEDKSFDADLNAVNSPSYKIATIDGAMEDIIAKTDFPKAKRVSLPELSPFSQNLLNVVTGKADITFAEPMVVSEFLSNNPGSLRQIHAEKPIRIFGNCLATKSSEIELKDFLDVAVMEIVNDGRAEKILQQYQPNQTTFYRLAQPYRVTSGLQSVQTEGK